MIDWLVCNHCGGNAFQSADDGSFRDGDSAPCATCGLSGQVIVDYWDEDCVEIQWCPDDEGKCNDKACHCWTLDEEGDE